MGLTVVDQVPAAGTQYAVNVLSQDFSSSSVTWNNQPTAYGGAALLPAAAVGGQATVDLTSTVAAWASGQFPSFGGWAGVAISPYSASGYTGFGAAEATGGVDPVLQVTYADLPAATIVSPAPYTACQRPDRSVNPAGCPPVVASTSPTVTIAQPGNPAGHTVQYWYQFFDGNDSSTTPPSGNLGDVVQSGWVPSLSWAPPPASLVDGRRYTLSVSTMVDGVLNLPARANFAVRLAAPGVVASDSVGPVSVNLASGSPSVALGSQSFATAGGAVSLGLDYDPQRAVSGFRGAYYSGCNATTSPWPAPTVTRADPVVGFAWGNDRSLGSPAAGAMGSGGPFCAYWSGLLTVPYTGTWQLGALGVSDGVLIQVASTTVLANWADHTGYHEYCTGVTTAACNQTLQAGVAYPISIWYYHNLSPALMMLAAKGPINLDGSYAAGQLNEFAVPAPWLAPPNRALPAGWRLSVPTDAAAYTSATFTANGVTLNTLGGPALAYTWNGSTYLPPDGETAALKRVTENGASVLKVADRDVTYTFDAAGKLTSTVSGADLAKPTSPSYTYDPSTGQVTRVTDPLSGRHLDVTYGSRSGGADPSCHVVSAGFDADPPVGAVCKIALPDGSSDRLYYTAGQLARLVTSIASGSTNPFGGNITDMGYDAQSRLVSLRDPLASDQVAAGVAAADTTSATVIRRQHQPLRPRRHLRRHLGLQHRRPTHRLPPSHQLHVQQPRPTHRRHPHRQQTREHQLRRQRPRHHHRRRHHHHHRNPRPLRPGPRTRRNN